MTEKLTAILSTGHAEYALQAPGLTETEIWAPLAMGGDDLFEDESAAAESFAEHLGAGTLAALQHDADLSWENVSRFTGPREAFEAALDALTADLAEPPSGNDTAFDYWPSGVRLAAQVAFFLQDMTRLSRLETAVREAFAAGDWGGAWTAETVNISPLDLTTEA